MGTFLPMEFLPLRQDVQTAYLIGISACWESDQFQIPVENLSGRDEIFQLQKNAHERSQMANKNAMATTHLTTSS